MTSKTSSKKKSKPPRKRGWNYPRAGLGPIRRWLPSWRFLFGSIFTLIALGLGAFAGLYIAIDVPEPDDFALAQATNVYYGDAEQKLGTFAEADRKSVELEEISADVQHAVIASEDRRFYENSGIDPKGILRALWNNIQGRPTQGGSTLTQQYAERYYTGQNSSLTGKVREAILAIKIDRKQSKDQILNNYLNTIYFGRGAYGIESAAQKYFGVAAKDLTLGQSALLAAVIPAPSAWDPAVDPETSKLKFDRVLRRMVEDQWISQEQASTTEFPETLDPATVQSDLSGTNGYLLQEVRNELVDDAGFTEEQIDRGGYTIVTTIDQNKQQAAVDAVNALPQDRPDNNHIGLMSVDPVTGETLAMYGGRDFSVRQQNSATQDRAQAGSVFKIFGVTAALKSGMSPNQTFASPASYTVPGTDSKFSNFGNASYGPLNLRDMAAYSVNTGFIQLNEKIGPAATAKMAVNLGLPEKLVGLDNNVGNILGSAAPTAKEMSRALSTLANGGKRLNAVHIVREVKDPDGNVIYRGDTASKQVISAETATLAAHVLQGGIAPYGTAAKLAGLQREIAAKTGTSTGPRSAWVATFTPNLVTVVDMYQVGENGSEEDLAPFGGIRLITGSSWPTEVAYNYLKVAFEGMEKVKFPNAQKIIDTKFPRPVPPKEEKEEEPKPEKPAEEEQPAPEIVPSQPENSEGGSGNGPSDNPSLPDVPGDDSGIPVPEPPGQEER
ncbi:Membrane carboxypeptidase (penicillin-binding protein) [Arcanobacterium phocae]|uniref:Membrane carboxypeptidase (Penicillin-binding protein) n=1 Tax=Arcanobacterium phocae TaxID=131112 RepID=A0A1H2LCI2_9ACTO|nr:transglycosylase domain-containing protein [Arcanobacterium phocae]SDU78445.1 Membrane carboxypeptidase (penicillin-binding protein) [Arcanobacterium phocae]